MTNENIIVCNEVGHNSADYKQMVALRYEILRKPLGLTFDPEKLNKENDSFHLAGWRNNHIVACLILTPLSGKKIRMRQLAVAQHLQSRGIGTQLVKFSESFAIQRGYNEIVLHARETAVKFYKKLGYRKKGPRFTEVTIPHYYMWKVLDLNT
jgi:predicted GNAT family N-acyltransferase